MDGVMGVWGMGACRGSVEEALGSEKERRRWVGRGDLVVHDLARMGEEKRGKTARTGPWEEMTSSQRALLLLDSVPGGSKDRRQRQRQRQSKAAHRVCFKLASAANEIPRRY